MKLTKAELLESIAEIFAEACRRTGREAHTPWVRNVTVAAVKVALSEIARRLKAGHTVALRDLGTFTVQKTKPRKRFDIATGKTVMRPGRSRIKFTPSPSLVTPACARPG
jgi:nucleoid DNA-binding protein